MAATQLPTNGDFRADAPPRGGLRAVGRQVMILTGAFVAYMGVRAIANGAETTAFANAADILHVESLLGVDWESAMQRFVLDRPSVGSFFNLVYAWMYWPMILGTFLFTWFKRRELFMVYRNAVMISGAIGLAVFAFFPVAPPRFLDGFVDTVDASQRSHFIAHPSFLLNKFAALPSFHVGWVALAAVVLMMATPSRARRSALFVLPVLMGIAVVVTGNHYIVDVIAGVGICLGALLLSKRVTRTDADADADAGSRADSLDLPAPAFANG